MCRMVVGEERGAGVREAAGRIKADEIGARWSLQRNDKAMSSGCDKSKSGDFDREHSTAENNHAPSRQQPLRPGMPDPVEWGKCNAGQFQ